MTPDWDLELYNRFRRYRAEPFEELVETLKLRPADRIVDLGCGSGENTVELARRVPSGFVFGVDSSAAMIGHAQKLRAGLAPALRQRVRFVRGDIAKWRPREEYSVVFSNAALQWLPDHRAAFAACFRALVPDGRLAVQMPANRDETAQATIAELAREAPWSAKLGRLRLPSENVAPAETYGAMLAEVGFAEVDCYYRVFRHPMRSPAEIVEWYRATALRPIVGALTPAESDRFLAALRERLEAAYGTTGRLVFDFRRLFILARRPN